ncbi:MAG: methyltransferase domain-containing protein [Acidimicrobiia bacterium]|nr:methyltransferase domain-containing protein [Acidimicrobiia bacterium]
MLPSSTRPGSRGRFPRRTVNRLTPEDWSFRYRRSDTPWDMGRANPLLSDLLAEDPGLGKENPGRVFVPGCGSGWDASVFHTAGWDVVAVDMASGAIEEAQKLVPSAVVGDALRWTDEPFRVVFDHTFFCALAPDDRPEFGKMADRVLGDDGRVVSVVFPIGRSLEKGGPPYGMSPEAVDEVLGDGFVRISTGPEATIGRRSWPHKLCIWERS